ncbi:DUF4145 domain-containing protein [Vogesella sp. EB]|uniref:DUF4145 domain-containing protein n=1 Tax=Vogesella sp. EB TaxID=1526735 RepID=UPI0012E0C34D|nr:DUF4145 domain-containing protein [Vogesella sp. EB]
MKDTNHDILCDVAESDVVVDNSTLYLAWDNSYQIVQCCGCESIHFRKTAENSDDVWVDDDFNSYPDIKVDVYPNPNEGRPPVNDDKLLPDHLRHIYLETLAALNSNQRILAGIGIRAIVETVCNIKQVAGRTLADKIDGLVTDGVMTNAGALILHQLRTLGNNAAHEVKPHDQVQLGLALDVIDHLLQGVFILPFHAQRKLPQA